MKFFSGTAVTMMGSYIVLILFAFLVEGVFGDAEEVKSVKQGNSVILNTDVTKGQNDTMLWYFENTRIALINGDPDLNCLYDGEDGRFRDRLKVDYETGSLTITDIRTEHTGRYEAEIIRIDSSGKSEKKKSGKCKSTNITKKRSNLGETIKSFRLTVSGLSPAVVAVIVVGVLLVAAAVVVVGVIYYRHRSSRNDMKKNKQVLEQVSNDEKQNEERHMI